MKTISLNFSKEQLIAVHDSLSEKAGKLPGFVQGEESEKNNFYQDILTEIEIAFDQIENIKPTMQVEINKPDADLV
jgi:hypothetical protein